jgi:hypothetical protein
MLVYGLMDWAGPAQGTNSLAVAMGFSDLEDLQDDASESRGRSQLVIHCHFGTGPARCRG